MFMHVHIYVNKEKEAMNFKESWVGSWEGLEKGKGRDQWSNYIIISNIKRNTSMLKITCLVRGTWKARDTFIFRSQITNHSPLKNRCKQFTRFKLYAMLEVLICAKFQNKNKKNYCRWKNNLKELQCRNSTNDK